MTTRLGFFESKFIFCSASTLVAFMQGCGSKTSNTNIPKPAAEITIADVQDNAFRKSTERWEKLLDALKLRKDGDESALKTPSRFFDSSTEGQQDYQNLLTSLKAEHLKSANRTSCAEVVDFQSIGNAMTFSFDPLKFAELTGVQWYLMKYRRKNSDGATDSTIHGAVVSVPQAAGRYPLIAFAHSGDQGLKLIELAAVLAEKQNQWIIVAPAFPGEAIYEAALFGGQVIFSAVGTSEPYSTDAEDLLAAQNCLVEATSVPSTITSIRDKIKTRTTGPKTGKAVTSTIGVSRGGMASLIALAKNEALISAGRPEAQFFSCAATAINPTSLIYDEFRIFLETIVKGTAEFTSFYTLPTAPQLSAFLKDYRDDKEGVTPELTASEIQKRDATFNAGLILGTLKNWSSSDKGSLLMMHATLDQKIPYSQALIGGKVFSDVNLNLRNAPGVHLTGVGFSPSAQDSNDGTTLKDSTATMHGDLVWFRSHGSQNTTIVDSNSWKAAPLNSGDFGFNVSPLNVLWSWLDDSLTGCASTH